MSTAVLDRLREERDQARDAAIAMAEAEDFNPTSEAFVGLETRAADLDKQIEHLTGLLSARDSADAIDGRLAKVQKRSDAKAQTETRESVGEQFVRSDVFKSYNGRGTSSRLEIDTRALPATLADWGDMLPSAPQISVQAPEPQNVILPLVTNIQVSQNSIEYVSYAKVAGGAAVVPEGTAKPSAEWAPTVTSATLDNIAVYTKMTRQLLEDASAVRSLIDSELRRDVARKEEAEAVAAVAGATLPTATGPSGKGILGAIRAGMAAVQSAGYIPTAFLVASDDLVDLDIQGWENGAAPYWGLRPVVDPNASAGTVIVGDFSAGVHRYTRSNISLYISDSAFDGDFTANLFTMLAERRSKTVVVRPAALVEATPGV